MKLHPDVIEAAARALEEIAYLSRRNGDDFSMEAKAALSIPQIEAIVDLPRLIELQREGTIDDARDEGWNAGLERAAAIVTAALANFIAPEAK